VAGAGEDRGRARERRGAVRRDRRVVCVDVVRGGAREREERRVERGYWRRVRGTGARAAQRVRALGLECGRGVRVGEHGVRYDGTVDFYRQRV